MIKGLINYAIEGYLGWRIDWLIDWSINWLIDWLIDRKIDWLIDWLIDRLIDRSIDRLTHLVPFLRCCIQFNITIISWGKFSQFRVPRRWSSPALNFELLKFPVWGLWNAKNMFYFLLYRNHNFHPFESISFLSLCN